MEVTCTGELHAIGGPGVFLLGKAEDLLDDLIKEYRGKVQVIYLDPPFGTGDTFHLRLSSGKKSLTFPAFTDLLSGDAYLDWMRVILTGCHSLLGPTGSLYLHIDHRMNAKMRILLDTIFGEKNFMNEIVWSYHSGGRSTRYYPRKHDTILFYRKSRNVYFDITAVGKPRGAERRNHMKRFVDESGRICFSIRSGGKTYTYHEDTPIYPSDVWDDIEHLQQRDKERVGYGTQKPEALLRRILLASSRPGDLVMDLFSGSGTTAATAVKLNRRFVVTDASPIAMYTLRARLLKNASAQPFLADASEMRLLYPAEKHPLTLSYTIEKTRGKAELVLAEAVFSGAQPMIYAAVGTMQDSLFLPSATACFPKLPLRLPLPDSDAPVLQLADAQGRQAFQLLTE